MVGHQTLFNNLRRFVRTLNQLAATTVADTVNFRRIGYYVVDCLTLGI
jgi:hypothetical protein